MGERLIDVPSQISNSVLFVVCISKISDKIKLDNAMNDQQDYPYEGQKRTRRSSLMKPLGL